jgi:hypothetical protein
MRKPDCEAVATKPTIMHALSAANSNSCGFGASLVPSSSTGSSDMMRCLRGMR